jgi:hypothetical protein
MSKFTISDLTIDEVNLIIVGLHELPGKFITSLVPKIREQMEAQGVRPAPGSQASGDPSMQPGPVPVGPLSSKVIG